MNFASFLLVCATLSTQIFKATPHSASWVSETKFQQVFDLILGQGYYQLWYLVNIDIWCNDDGDLECRQHYETMLKRQVRLDPCPLPLQNESDVRIMPTRKLERTVCQLWKGYNESGFPCLQAEYAPFFKTAYIYVFFVLEDLVKNIPSFCRESVNVILTTSVLATHKRFRSDCSWDIFVKALALIDDAVVEMIPQKCKDIETIANWLDNLSELRVAPSGLGKQLQLTITRLDGWFQDPKHSADVQTFDNCSGPVVNRSTINGYTSGLCNANILDATTSRQGAVLYPIINKFIESCLTPMTSRAAEHDLACNSKQERLFTLYKHILLFQTIQFNMVFLPFLVALPPSASFRCLAKYTVEFPICIRLALKSESLHLVRHFTTIKNCYKRLYTKRCPNPSETFLNDQLTILWNETLRRTKDDGRSDLANELQNTGTMIKIIGDLQSGQDMYKKVFKQAKEENCQLINEESQPYLSWDDQKRIVARDCTAEISSWFRLETDLKLCQFSLNTQDYSALYTTVQKFRCGIEDFPVQAFEVSHKDNNTKLLCFDEMYPSILSCMESKERLPTGITYATSLCKPVIKMRACFHQVYTSPQECLHRNRTGDVDILNGFVVDLFDSLESHLECNNTIFESVTTGNKTFILYTLITIPMILLMTLIVVSAGYLYKLKLATYGIISKEELEEFENGIGSQENEQSSNGDNEPMNIGDVTKQPYNKIFEIPRDQLVLYKDQQLGKGAYGQVVKGILMTDKENPDVAVKTVLPGTTDANKDYFRALLFEIKVMIYIGRHPNIVNFLGAITKGATKGKLFVILEICEFGSLLDHLTTNRDKYIKHRKSSVDDNYENTVVKNPQNKESFSFKTDMAQLMKWASEIATGMNFLSSKKVIHGDLATRNVLINSQGVAKITDFGLSRKLYESLAYVKQSTSPLPWRWLAPECLEFFTFSPASDVWAYGVLLWEMFTFAETPYDGATWSVHFVERFKEGFRLGKPQYATDAIYEEAILECWRLEPSERANFDFLGLYFFSLYNSMRFDVEKKRILLREFRRYD